MGLGVGQICFAVGLYADTSYIFGRVEIIQVEPIEQAILTVGNNINFARYKVTTKWKGYITVKLGEHSKCVYNAGIEFTVILESDESKNLVFLERTSDTSTLLLTSKSTFGRLKIVTSAERLVPEVIKCVPV